MTKFKIGDIVRVETKRRKKPVVGVFAEYLSEDMCLIMEGDEFWYMREHYVTLVRPERHETMVRHIKELGIISEPWPKTHDDIYFHIQEMYVLFYADFYTFDDFLEVFYKDQFRRGISRWQTSDIRLK